jgi:hypothetical protein
MPHVDTKSCHWPSYELLLFRCARRSTLVFRVLRCCFLVTSLMDLCCNPFSNCAPDDCLIESIIQTYTSVFRLILTPQRAHRWLILLAFHDASAILIATRNPHFRGTASGIIAEHLANMKPDQVSRHLRTNPWQRGSGKVRHVAILDTVHFPVFI